MKTAFLAVCPSFATCQSLTAFGLLCSSSSRSSSCGTNYGQLAFTLARSIPGPSGLVGDATAALDFDQRRQHPQMQALCRRNAGGASPPFPARGSPGSPRLHKVHGYDKGPGERSHRVAGTRRTSDRTSSSRTFARRTLCTSGRKPPMGTHGPTKCICSCLPGRRTGRGA